MRLIAPLFLTFLAACAPPPEVSAALQEPDQALATPKLLPLPQLLSNLPPAGAATDYSIEARSRLLRTRAAALRQSSP